MELVFETVELVAFTDKPYGAFYSMNDLNWVYESLAKQECQFGGFFLLNPSVDVEDMPHMSANTYDKRLLLITTARQKASFALHIRTEPQVLPCRKC